VSVACRLTHNGADRDAVVTTFLQIVSALGIIAGLLAVMATLWFGFCWTVLLLLRFVPVIGRRHRHTRWDELTKRSARGRDVTNVDQRQGP
jgi:membrane protein required for beta-lactamase induction